MMTLIFYNAANEVVALTGTTFTVKPFQQILPLLEAIAAGFCDASTQSHESPKYIDVTHRDKLQIFGGALEQAHSSAPHGDHIAPDLRIEQYVNELGKAGQNNVAIFINLRPLQESNRATKSPALSAA